MNKYIIEIEDVPFSKVRIDADGAQNINLYRAKGFSALVFDEHGLDKLTPFDKALSSELEEAYQKGFEVGSHETTTLEYQQGLGDAWETIIKIALIPYAERSEIFDGQQDILSIMQKFSPSEVITKIKAYEQQKADEIKVGDEVAPINALSRPFVVVSVKDNVIHGFDLNGGCTSRGYFLHETHLKKTGRRFPQVAELLKAIKEGAE